MSTDFIFFYSCAVFFFLFAFWDIEIWRTDTTRFLLHNFVAVIAAILWPLTMALIIINVRRNLK